MGRFSLSQLLAIMIGGATGCVIRWFLGIKLNSFYPSIPPGTLMVNLMGAFIIGAAMAYFMRHPQLDPAWKMFIVTGLCGGLTTFSTFSVEVFSLLQTGNYLSALTSVLVHVVGSLLMTAAGFYLIMLLI